MSRLCQSCRKQSNRRSRSNRSPRRRRQASDDLDQFVELAQDVIENVSLSASVQNQLVDAMMEAERGEAPGRGLLQTLMSVRQDVSSRDLDALINHLEMSTAPGRRSSETASRPRRRRSSRKEKRRDRRNLCSDCRQR
jgi:hypothetical protein